MDLSLSTSWLSAGLSDAQDLIKALEKMDIHGLELEYRLQHNTLNQLKNLLRTTPYTVVSVHNYCPFPALKPNKPPSGDYFELSALDPEERKWAVEYTTRTIEHAHDMEAGVVVLHCGAVQMASRFQAVGSLLEAEGGDSPKLKSFMTKQMDLREKRKGPNMDALLFSLDRLMPVAEKYHVRLGIENRYHYHELPGHEELAVIFSEFEGGPAGYWHDTGHAHTQEVLGNVTQQTLLDHFGRHMVGMHLHDALGLKDHLPPGKGNIDFDLLRPYIDQPIPIVLELASGTPLATVSQAVSTTQSLYGAVDPEPSDDFSLDLENKFI